MKKLLATLLCATTMTLSVAACGSAESSSTQKDEGTASTQSAENSQSTDGFKIGFTDNYNGNSYHQAMEKYMTEAADKLKAVEMNYEKLKSHGKSALDIVKEDYTWSQIADKYIKLGKEL